MSKLENRRYHIIVDAYNCDPQILGDKHNLKTVIRDIVELCEMKILHGPVILEGVPQNPGITGFAILDFSHISIHTFTAENEICIDVFSCKKYDYDKVKHYVMNKFNLDEKYVKYIEIKYPVKPALNNTYHNFTVLPVS